VLTPSQKGAIAEAEVTAAAIRIGIIVARPLTEGQRYDLIFDLGWKFLRVQCKWGRLKNGVVQARLGTCRHTPGGYVRTTYRLDEIDAFVVFCADLRRCFLLPIAEFAGQGFAHLRVAPTGNCQARLVKWAADYDLGAIAQLGERVTGSHEAAGSSPASSTQEAARQGGLFER
jgi:PD-(D/E)XK endonuclease